MVYSNYHNPLKLTHLLFLAIFLHNNRKIESQLIQIIAIIIIIIFMNTNVKINAVTYFN